MLCLFKLSKEWVTLKGKDGRKTDDGPSLGMRERETTDGLMPTSLVDAVVKNSLRAGQVSFPCAM